MDPTFANAHLNTPKGDSKDKLEYIGIGSLHLTYTPL